MANLINMIDRVPRKPNPITTIYAAGCSITYICPYFFRFILQTRLQEQHIEGKYKNFLKWHWYWKLVRIIAAVQRRCTAADYLGGSWMSVILLLQQPWVGWQSIETVPSLQRIISVSKIAQKPLGYVTEPFFLDRKASKGRRIEWFSFKLCEKEMENDASG